MRKKQIDAWLIRYYERYTRAVLLLVVALAVVADHFPHNGLAFKLMGITAVVITLASTAAVFRVRSVYPQVDAEPESAEPSRSPSA
jgi:hypothetical protein